MSAERVLTGRELNRALLARQLLLERGRMSLPRALERIGGIQAQYAPSMYIGLWSRLEGFDRDRLTRALARRTVVQATLMRVTIHLVSRGDFWPLAHATRLARQRAWLRPRRHLDAAAMEEAAAIVRERLRAEGPLRRAELDALVGSERAAGVGMWVDLVRVPPSGTWERRRADLFGLAETWLGSGEQVTAEKAEELLVRRCLAGFGPQTRADIAAFTGLQVREVARVLDRLELRRFRSEDGEELVDLPRLPLPPADTPAPARFLPSFDATLLAHVRRTGILAEEHRAWLAAAGTSHPAPMFLVDGVVAGTWRHVDGRIELRPFGRLDAAARRELGEEGERLAALHA
jgi:hypothetical protein